MGNLIKKELRKQILGYRRLLSGVLYEQRNQLLNSSIQKELKRRKVSSVHLFLPMEKNKEPDCYPTLHWAWQHQIRTLTTRTDFESKTLQHFLFDEATEIKRSNKGIPEPQNAEESGLEKLDALLVPLLAFDKSGHRVGYGGGYYDQIIAELSDHTIKIGLCLSGGMDAFSFVESHDRALDMIITPFEIIHTYE